MDPYFHQKYFNNYTITNEPIEMCFSGTSGFGKKVACLLHKNGMGIDKLYLNISLPVLPEGVTWVPNAIFKIIRNLKYNIGGETVKMFNWVGIYIDLLENGYNTTTLNTLGLQKQLDPIISHDLYIPLPYIIAKNFPLIISKLTAHEVRVFVEYELLRNLVCSSNEFDINVNGDYMGNHKVEFYQADLMVDYLFTTHEGYNFLEKVEEVTYDIVTNNTLMESTLHNFQNFKASLNPKNIYNVFTYSYNHDNNMITNNVKELHLQCNGHNLTSPLKPLHTLVLTWLNSSLDCGIHVHYLPFNNMSVHGWVKGLIDTLKLHIKFIQSSDVGIITSHKEQFQIKNGCGYFVQGYNYYNDTNWFNNVQIHHPYIAPPLPNSLLTDKDKNNKNNKKEQIVTEKVNVISQPITTHNYINMSTQTDDELEMNYEYMNVNI